MLCQMPPPPPPQWTSDPLITLGPLPARTATEVLRAMGRLRTHWAGMTLPLYAHHGDTDRCTSLSGTRAFVEAAASRDKARSGRGGLWRGAPRPPAGRSRAPLPSQPPSDGPRGGTCSLRRLDLAPAIPRQLTPPLPFTRQLLHVVRGGYHELLTCPGGEALVREMADWVAKRWRRSVA